MSDLKKFAWGNVSTDEWHEMDRVVMVLDAGPLYDKYLRKVLDRWRPEHTKTKVCPLLFYAFGPFVVVETGVAEGEEFVAEREGRKIKAVRVEGRVEQLLQRLHEIWEEVEDICRELEEMQEAG